MRLLDVAHEFPTYVATLNEALMNIFKYKRFELCKKSCPVTCLSDNFQAAKNEISVQLLRSRKLYNQSSLTPQMISKETSHEFSFVGGLNPMVKKIHQFKLDFFSPQAKKNWVKYLKPPPPVVYICSKPP